MADITSADYRYEPDVVLPPGDTLSEVLDEAGMTQAELAKRTGLSTKHINQIVNGSAPVTPETALLLDRATGVSARVWNNLEVAYREQLSRRVEEDRLAADLGWLDELPINELIRRGWVERGASPIERLRSVCRFFGVANRAAWDALWHKPTAYRTSKAFKSDPGAVAAWLRIGEIEAASIRSEPFDRNALMDLLDDLRSLTMDPDPGSWWPALVTKCARVGIAVVVEPEIKGARINGAARWVSPDKALVQLSLRHRWNDIFWFTLFHEIGHLLIHSKKDTFINDVGAHSGVEQEADGFASQVLIPRQQEAGLNELSTLKDVEEFAGRLGIAPGIVVGRLQHDGRWPYNRGNDLKQRFIFSGQ
jgi:HTH-type transcriptional regulator / antitoxin HigA